MTLQECTATLTPFALALRASFDGPTFRAYHRVLEPLPVALLEAALSRLMSQGVKFFPTAPEIATTAEKLRRQAVALHPYTGCAECEHQIGWRQLTTAAGQVTVQPCPCRARHQGKLESLGLLTAVAELPGESEPQTENHYPSAAQLPAGIRTQLQAVADRKVLR